MYILLDDEEFRPMCVKVLDDYHSTSDSDDQQPPPTLPQRPPVDYHTFSPRLDDSFQDAMSLASPRRSIKRSSRNRSISFSRSAKECKQTITNSDCYDSAPNLHHHNQTVQGHNMEFDHHPSNVAPPDAHRNQHPDENHRHHSDQLYPYSNRSAKSIPGKEEMPKLIPTALEEPMERMETNDPNVAESDDDDDDDAPPPLLSPKLATNYAASQSPAEGEDSNERGFHAANSHSSEPMMEAPPMLTNASIPTNESVPSSHRGPESLQNPASRRSSTEMQQQSHSVPTQSISHPQQSIQQQHQMLPQQPPQPQIPPWQQQHVSNEMYGMQPQQIPQSQPLQSLQHEQPRSHPQQMTPQQMTPLQQPPSMPPMSDPTSVYSMPQSQHSSGVPSHPMPPQQPMQQQLSYPPPQPSQEIMKSAESMPNPQQQPPVVEKPKPKPKRQPKKKDSTSAVPSSAAMLPQQRYAAPYDASQFNLFQPYMAQISQFPGQAAGYPSYPNHYPSANPNLGGYPAQQFNHSFNPWTNQSAAAAAYPGYPAFMPPMAAAAAQSSSKFYSQMTGYQQLAAAAAMGGGGNGVGGPSGVAATPHPMNSMMAHPAAFQQPAAATAAAAAAAANWQRPLTQNLNPYDLYPYNNLT